MDEKDSPAVPPAPEQPVSHGQRAPTPEELRKALAPRAPVQEYLGQDLPVSLTGLAAAKEEVTFNQAGLAALNAMIGTLRQTLAATTADLGAERDRSQALQERAGAADVRAGIAESSLRGEQDSNSLRSVVNTLGGVLVGFAPSAHSAWGPWGAAIAAVIGAAIVVSAWIFRRRGPR